MYATRRFPDRKQAGAALAQALVSYARRSDVIVLALPRGGVPVAFEVAKTLAVPLDVLVVRKLGMPGRSEYAMGAVASGGLTVLNAEAIQMLRIPMTIVEQVRQREALELERRETLYRAHRPTPQLQEKTVVLIDDGLATGSTMQAAVQAVRTAHPARVIVAVPVAAPETRDKLAVLADDIVCLSTPDPFYAVGLWYDDFEQTTDDEVIALLDSAAHEDADRDAHARHPTAGQEASHGHLAGRV